MRYRSKETIEAKQYRADNGAAMTVWLYQVFGAECMCFEEEGLYFTAGGQEYRVTEGEYVASLEGFVHLFTSQGFDSLYAPAWNVVSPKYAQGGYTGPGKPPLFTLQGGYVVPKSALPDWALRSESPRTHIAPTKPPVVVTLSEGSIRAIQNASQGPCCDEREQL